MTIRRVGIIWNPTKPRGIDVARSLAKLLAENGVEIYTDTNLAEVMDGTYRVVEDFNGCDVLIALGGDGTMISAMDLAVPYDIPMLGINLGKLGFLTEMEPDELKAGVSRLISGDYSVEKRMLMRVCECSDDSAFALNDIVIKRSESRVRLLTLEIEINGAVIDRFSGDGLIIASATGSTAYSLSAGGPIVVPGLECFVLTPICPHKLNVRPVVASADDEVIIRVADDADNAQAVFDGRRIYNLSKEHSEVTVVRERRCARFIRLREANYFGVLRRKLSDWTL